MKTQEFYLYFADDLKKSTSIQVSHITKAVTLLKTAALIMTWQVLFSNPRGLSIQASFLLDSAAFSEHLTQRFLMCFGSIIPKMN